MKKTAAGLQAKIVDFRSSAEAHNTIDVLRDALSACAHEHDADAHLNDRSYTADEALIFFLCKNFRSNERGGGQDFRAVGVLADYGTSKSPTKQLSNSICAKN